MAKKGTKKHGARCPLATVNYLRLQAPERDQYTCTCATDRRKP